MSKTQSTISKLAKKSFRWLTGGDDRVCPAFVGWSGTQFGSLAGEKEASENSVVMACVYWAMRNVAQASFFIEQLDQGEWSRVDGHLAEQMLRSPQALLPMNQRSGFNGSKLLSALTYSRMMSGNAYLLKLRDVEGQLIGLDWLPHGAVTPVASPERPGIVSHYLIQTPQGQISIDRLDIVHDREGTDPNNQMMGMSRLSSLKRLIATDNEAVSYGQAILRSPAPSLMVTAKQDNLRITPEEAEQLAKKIQEATSGKKAGSVIVPTFPAGIDTVGFSPEQLALDRLNKLPEERIAAVFGIPAIVLGLGTGLERSTYSNVKEAREAAAEEFLIPLWKDLAATFTDQILPEFDSGLERRVTFNTHEVSILQEDRENLHERVRKDFEAGLIEREEARKRIGIGS